MSKAIVYYTHHDTSQQVYVNDHDFQVGGQGDGFCYSHQSFNCIDEIVTDPDWLGEWHEDRDTAGAECAAALADWLSTRTDGCIVMHEDEQFEDDWLYDTLGIEPEVAPLFAGDVYGKRVRIYNTKLRGPEYRLGLIDATNSTMWLKDFK